MTATTMTPAQLARFEARLMAERADAEERLAEFDDAMAEVRTARSDATADDEHAVDVLPKVGVRGNVAVERHLASRTLDIKQRFAQERDLDPLMARIVLHLVRHP